MRSETPAPASQQSPTHTALLVATVYILGVRVCLSELQSASRAINTQPYWLSQLNAEFVDFLDSYLTDRGSFALF
jgi:hypothetical protein